MSTKANKKTDHYRQGVKGKSGFTKEEKHINYLSVNFTIRTAREREEKKRKEKKTSMQADWIKPFLVKEIVFLLLSWRKFDVYLSSNGTGRSYN